MNNFVLHEYHVSYLLLLPLFLQFLEFLILLFIYTLYWVHVIVDTDRVRNRLVVIIGW